MPVVDQRAEQTQIASPDQVARWLRTFAARKRPVSDKRSMLWLAAMSVISAIVIPSQMLLSTGAPDDSSVFAYIGWGMKHGLRPYRDIWDHKGPLLYYLQFAGMSLWPSSTFGIGLVEVTGYAVMFFLMYRVITSFTSWFGAGAVAVFSVVFITHCYSGGNLCESWALLPLAGAHYACWRWSQGMAEKRWAATIGACFACVFWLRPNMAAYPAVGMLALLYASRKTQPLATAMKQLAVAAVAALGVSLLILSPIYDWGAFREFTHAYFGYNAAYSNALHSAARWLHTRQLLLELLASGIAILAIAGWALGVAKACTRNGKVAGELPAAYLKTLLFSLPFEIAAATLSGRDYTHYLLPLFPTLAALAAWFISEFEALTKAIPGTIVRPALIAGLLLALGGFTFAAYPDDFSRATAPPGSEYLVVENFIENATAPTDKVLVVGATEAAYVMVGAQRLPASRFVYQFPLIDVNNPFAGKQREQFMRDLAENRPRVIVSGTSAGILCASEPECILRNPQDSISQYGYKSAILPNLMRELIASEYRPVSDARFGAFRVFLRTDIALPKRW